MPRQWRLKLTSHENCVIFEILPWISYRAIGRDAATLLKSITSPRFPILVKKTEGKVPEDGERERGRDIARDKERE